MAALAQMERELIIERTKAGLKAAKDRGRVDGQFRGPDKQVHQTKGYDYYSEFSLWDTFRAENPLLTLVQPQRVNDYVQRYCHTYLHRR